MNRAKRKELIDHLQFSEWYEWNRIFLFIPKKDVTGKYVFGKVWKRERYGSVLGEYDPKTHTQPVYSAVDISYATNKYVFMDKLKDTKQ